jgi:hypothetical protein
MSSVSSHRPILLLHPDRLEAVYLRDRLAAAGVLQPIVISPSSDDARDYLLAATVAQPLDARYVPCVALLDEKLGEAEFESFVSWIRQQPAVANMHVVRLTSEAESRAVDEASCGAYHQVGTADRLHVLRELIARSCGGSASHR